MKQLMDVVGLREAIIEKHYKAQGYQPTYQRGYGSGCSQVSERKYGSSVLGYADPIDGIFISDSLNISADSYSPFGEAPLDHQAQWISLSCNIAFGYTMEEPQPISAFRLKNIDPRVVKQFQKLYDAFLSDHKLYEKLYALQDEFYRDGWSDSLAQRYNEIGKSRKEAIIYADRHCWKLNMGKYRGV